MRILIISYFFPPFNAIGAVRVGKIAKYLSSFGHDVRVVSARDQPLQPTLELEIPETAVTYTRWFNVNRVAELAVGGRDHVAAHGYRNARLQRVSLTRFAGQAYKAVLNFPDGEIGWWPHAYRAGAQLCEAWRPDVIYASARPFTGHLVAAALGARYRIPWVAELRDLWVDNPNYPFGGLRKWLERLLERRVYSRVAGFTTVSQPLASLLEARYRRPVRVVTNGFDRADYPQVDRCRDAERLDIAYTGMLYPGKQDLRPLFRALRLMGPMGERVRVRFFGRYLDSVRTIAAEEGVGHLVEVHEAVPYAESLRVQGSADLLLLLLWNDPTVRGVFTGKLFEYVGARRPILATGPDSSEAADLIRSRSLGVVLGEPEDIASYLRTVLLEKERNGEIADLPESGTVGLSREEQTRVLESFLLPLAGSAT